MTTSGSPQPRAADSSPFDRDGLRVVDHAVDERRRGGRVREDAGPFAKGQVRGDSVESPVRLLLLGEAG